MKKLPILLSLLFVSIATFGQSGYNTSRTGLFQKLTIDSNDIIFLGNSITDGCEWAELFDNSNVKNRGISGDRTEWMLNRLDPILDGKPKKVFLMIGTNDLAWGISRDVVLSNIKELVSRFKHESPKTDIYIQSILPVNGTEFDKFHGHYDQSDNIQKLNNELEIFCESDNIQYIDLHSSFINKDGLLDSRYTYDGLHLTGDGYLLWRDLIKKHVK